MAAFEKVRSGIPQMDEALDFIRLGDNVVFRVSELSEFQTFALPVLRQAAEDGRTIVYVRFAPHEAIVSHEERQQLGIITEHVELSHRFETFTVDVHHLIEHYGKDVFYVFDCLSDLQTAWATDLMMGNFFRVTCPYLFSLDTVALFPLIRGKHSLRAMEKIRSTTQLFLDVYADPDRKEILYLRPEKVWNREDRAALRPHIYNRTDHTLLPITDGVLSSRFYRAYEKVQRTGDEQNIDSWDRFFRDTQRRFEDGQDVQEAADRMCRIMMSRDERMRVLIRANFTVRDYLNIRSRLIGTGLIGGKACGMLTARKILENHAPEVYAHLEPHDSFYVGSDVFYSYIVDNGFWDLRVRQRTPEGYFSLAPEFAQKLRSGRFSHDVRGRFAFLLDYYGHDPYIVRSSSILEDGFGNAFAGKYESVFCANTGTRQDRLAELENAVRTVYASTMNPSALDYRLRRGLEKRDEQMALLIQRVSGSHYGRYVMPCAAGVGYSVSPYRVRPDLDPKAGMLRLVMGLGTSAVDRREGSYPRIVGLDRPEATTLVSSADRHRFSQRKIELIDTEARQIVQTYPDSILSLLPAYLKKTLLEHDYDAERAFRERGQRREIFYISCHGLVKNAELMGCFRQMLKVIGDTYNYPVDIEYTINLAPDGDFVVNLLQCRPLQAFHDTGAGKSLTFPEHPDPAAVLLQCRHASMGVSCVEQIDGIVYVDPQRYYRMKYADKPDVATLVGEISMRLQGLKVLLMVPGRIGTSSPELGVPASFAQISGFAGIFELAESRIGYNPELSYGSHMFQDLVEAGILYAAVFEGGSTLAFHPELLAGEPAEEGGTAQAGEAQTTGGTGEAQEAKAADVVQLCAFSQAFHERFPDTAAPEHSCTLYHDMVHENLLLLRE